jgi:hypothetical protein
MDNELHIVLIDYQDNRAFNANGFITALSYGPPDELAALDFQVSGEVIQTFAEQ